MFDGLVELIKDSLVEVTIIKIDEVELFDFLAVAFEKDLLIVVFLFFLVVEEDKSVVDQPAVQKVF